MEKSNDRIPFVKPKEWDNWPTVDQAVWKPPVEPPSVVVPAVEIPIAVVPAGKSPVEVPKEVEKPEEVPAQPVKRGPGRPPGSKNKNKRLKKKAKIEAEKESANAVDGFVRGFKSVVAPDNAFSTSASSCPADFDSSTSAPSCPSPASVSPPSSEDGEAELRWKTRFALQNLKLEKGEHIVEHNVFLSVAKAMEEDRTGVVSALTKERVKILGKETWREVTEEELAKIRAEGTEILPVVTIITRKRDNSWKARIIVLGNRQKVEEGKNLEFYAPTVSQAANRTFLVEAAAGGDFILAFDVLAAFLNAQVGSETYVRIPQELRTSDVDLGIRRLQKALYGLKASPRDWYETFTKKLVELGWERSECDLGLWRKRSEDGRSWLKLSVFVDDCLASGKHFKEISEAVKKITDEFESRPIPSQSVSFQGLTWVYMDTLGGDLYYSREGREFRLVMGSYIEKMLGRFRMSDCSPRFSLWLDEKELHSKVTEEKEVEFPIRAVIGSAQWISTVCRPDIAVFISGLARIFGKTKKCTPSLVRACKRLLAFLKGTKFHGVEFSPAREREFARQYGALCPEDTLGNVAHFGDASFASSFEFKSFSGGITYVRGTPVQWKHKMQGVRAFSTAESETIASSDAIVQATQNNFYQFFSEEEENAKEPFFCDNTAAIQTAKANFAKAKSRHFHLRWWRVREVAAQGRLFFCPTDEMRADGLTKVATDSQREMLLYGLDPKLSVEYDDITEQAESWLILV